MSTATTKRQRDSLTIDGATYRIAMCFYGEMRNTIQTHHILIDNPEESDILIACGVDVNSTEDSHKTFHEFFSRSDAYGICRRCLKSRVAKILWPHVEPQIAAYREALRAANAMRDMDTMHDNANAENRRFDARLAALAVVAAVGLTPDQCKVLENAVHLCGTLS